MTNVVIRLRVKFYRKNLEVKSQILEQKSIGQIFDQLIFFRDIDDEKRTEETNSGNYKPETFVSLSIRLSRKSKCRPSFI